jgi:hypothetical protein
MKSMITGFLDAMKNQNYSILPVKKAANTLIKNLDDPQYWIKVITKPVKNEDVKQSFQTEWQDILR